MIMNSVNLSFCVDDKNSMSKDNELFCDSQGNIANTILTRADGSILELWDSIAHTHRVLDGQNNRVSLVSLILGFYKDKGDTFRGKDTTDTKTAFSPELREKGFHHIKGLNRTLKDKGLLDSGLRFLVFTHGIDI